MGIATPRGQMTRHPSVPSCAITPSFLHNLAAWLQLLSHVTSPARKSDLKTSRDGMREVIFTKYPFKLCSIVTIVGEALLLVLFQNKQR